jgi:hypothetical protein
MAGYASGTYALALCDRCGQRFKLNALRKEWTGFKVCSTCYEPKHPQLEPKRSIREPIAVREPRPDRVEPVTVYIGGPGDSTFAAVGMQPAPVARSLVAGAMLGNYRAIVL